MFECLKCSLPICDEKQSACFYSITKREKRKKQEYSPAVASQQKAYRERNKDKYRSYWLKAYYKRKANL